MNRYTVIDFETANPKRVSACQIGFAIIDAGQITRTGSHLIKPVGGHAAFQTKIHGITEQDTCDCPDFGELFESVQALFEQPVIGYSLFDEQVIAALSRHFNLRLWPKYIDACSVARIKLPDLPNHKLKTVAKRLEIPKFAHHDAEQDAIACANIYLKLMYDTPGTGVSDENVEDVFKGFVGGIVADNEVNYKEAYSLLYWLEW